jgi:hypothetical protein
MTGKRLLEVLVTSMENYFISGDIGRSEKRNALEMVVMQV